MAQADVSILIKAKDEASKTLNKMSGTLKKLGKVAVVAIGVAVAAAFAKAVTSAAKFEQQMSDVSTLISGDSTKAIGQLEDGIKSMLSRVPKSAEELGASAYAIVSAGISDTSEALDVLEQSARLATAGLGTTEEATDLMTSAINTFKWQGMEAAEISDVLFKTVKNGKTTVSELAQSFGASAPIISEAGISLQDFSAATAALTTTGLPASQAQMGLRQAIVALNKPTAEMSSLFKKIGVKDGKELISTSENLEDVFKKLKDATGGNNEAWGKAIGSVEALNAVTGVLTTTNESYNATLDDMVNGVNAVDEAFEKQKETFNSQWQILKNKLEVALINLGNVVLPILLNIAYAVADAFEWLKKVWEDNKDEIMNFVNGLKGFFLPILEAIWFSIQNELIPALKEWWRLAGPVLMPVLKALAVLIGGVLLGAITTIMLAILGLIKVLATMQRWWNSSVNFAINITARFIRYITGIPNAVRGAFNTVASTIGNAFSGAMSTAKNVVTSAVNWIIDKVNGVIRTANSISSKVGGPTFGEIDRLANGTVNFGGGMAIVGERGPEMVTLPQGARVTRNEDMPMGNTTNIYGNITLSNSEAVDRFFMKIDKQQELARYGI